jgi:hypothetical protein
MATTKKKTFDAVAQSRRWRRATTRKLSTMTDEEKLAFLNRRLAAWPATGEQAPAKHALAHH